MPIQFTCPHCGAQTNVADEYAGQTGPCAACGNTVTIPPLSGAITHAPPMKRSTGPVVIIVALVVALGAFLVCGGILAALLLPAVGAAREAARRSMCSNNLKQIGLALHNYHDTYRCFPPAYIPDEDGQPMHSWRVLILPFLEAGALHDAYNFDEPWDSPNNLALANMMPTTYRCPSDTQSGDSETSYTMIVGPETISDGPKATKMAEITDGTSNTILVVEAAGSGINWMDPRDLDAAQISHLVNDPVDGGVESEHMGGANVLFCDGAVTFLSESIDPELMKAMSTIAGGEAVDPYSLGGN